MGLKQVNKLMYLDLHVALRDSPFLIHFICFCPFLKHSMTVVCNIKCIKKANKRLYFIVLLKRANVPLSDIVNFYCTVIRPVLEYCAPVFHHALPQYLSDDIERVQKRALSIICPYAQGLSQAVPLRQSGCN